MKRLFSIVAMAIFAMHALALEVGNLRVAGYQNPIGIDVATPVMGWVLESDDRGVMQQSYSIRIATDRDLQNVVWESGTVESDQSVDVVPTGFTADARTRYYWQVTVTDNKGNTATSTEKAYFETGLMKTTAWNKTKWIKATTLPQGSAGEATVIKDYEVEVKFEIKSLAAGLIFAASDHSNYYMWQINTKEATPRFRPHVWSGGNPSCIAENALGVNVKNNEQHTLRIEVRDAKTATTYIDGQQVDTRTGNFTYGSFGFREDYDNGNQPEEALFDDFIVTSGGETLLREDFNGTDAIFSAGTLTDGRLDVKGPGTYSWSVSTGKYVRYDVDVDMTLVNDNASICFSATGSNTYMMWAINTMDVAKPVVRRHVYNGGALNYSDTPTNFSKSDIIGHQHHIKLECETPYVRTYIDGQLVDTYRDGDAVLAMGDLGFRVSATGNEREKAYFDNLKLTTYDAEGNAHVTISEDFEAPTSLFDGADLRDFDGSKQLYMEAPVGSAKRLMQTDGSCLPGMPMVRKEFTAKSGIQKARLYATGLGVYNVYINGTRVGITDDDGNTEQDELKPGSTDFKKTVFYTTHDITSLLREGENAVGAELSNGWWVGGIAHGEFGNKPLAFRGQIIITYEDGTEEIIPTDNTWTSNTNGALRMGDIYNGEHYDARLESNWASPEYDDSEWFATAVSTDFTGTIRAFEGPAVKSVPSLARHPQTTTIYEGTKANGKTYGTINVISEYNGEAASAFELKAGQTAVIDLGQNAAGWVAFKALGERGARLRFRFGEMTNTSGDRGRGDDGPCGSLYTENLRSAEATLYYTLRGDADGEAFHPTSTFFGFRYIEVTTSKDVKLSNVVGETVTSAMDEHSSFTTSHPDVNKLYSNIMWGQRSNFLSVPTDCPQRDERLGWAADTQVYSMAGLYNTDIRNFYKKWMRDMRDSQNQNGAFPHVAPYSWGVGYGAAAWADAGVILPWNVYLMTGDKQILKDNWAAMEKYMDFLATRTGDGYQYNGGETTYGDWVSFVNTDSRFCSVSYYALDAQLMAKMARVLSTKDGDTYSQKAVKYETLFDNIKAEWQKRYLNTRGALKISTQCAYLMALHYNLLPDQDAIDRAINSLRSNIVNNGDKLTTGFLGTAILNQTLTEVGLNDQAYTLLLQRECPSWMYSIDQGATTIWERWNSYTIADGYGPVSMNSFNHYSYGIVAEWMFRHMAGIVPDEQQAGFKHFVLQPNPDTRETLPHSQARITDVAADFWSQYGSIKAGWQCDGGSEMTYSVTVPANTTATLVMPVAEGYELLEDGGSINSAMGVEYVGTQDGKVVCNLGSGTYRFAVAEASGISNAFAGNTLADNHIYNLQGQMVNSNYRGVAIIGGKKIIK